LQDFAAAHIADFYLSSYFAYLDMVFGAFCSVAGGQ
jgi:hypothetical protein